MKVQRITIQNFKAIAEIDMQLDGASVLLVGGNGSGKTTVGRIADILTNRSRPAVPLRRGTEEGFAQIELSDGTLIEWKFNEQEDSLVIIDPSGKVVRKPAQLIAKLVGSRFDIDAFMNEQPAKQRKMLAQIAGIDLDDLDARYKTAYEERAAIKRDLAASAARVGEILDPVFRISAASLLEQVEQMRAKNAKREDAISKLAGLEAERDGLLIAIESLSAKHKNAMQIYNDLKQAAPLVQHAVKQDFDSSWQQQKNTLEAFLTLSDFFDTQIRDIYAKKIEAKETLSAIADRIRVANEYIPTMPRFSEDDIKEVLDKISSIDANNLAAMKYESQQEALAAVELLRKELEAAQLLVDAINAERTDLLKSNPLPADGLEFGEDGLLLNGLPFSDSQIATSAKMLAAVQIAASLMGDLKFVHFDASILDKNSAQKLMSWASQNGLQLAMERADWEGGGLRYELQGR